MIQGLYTAATAMYAVESRQDIIANNVANAGTPGFKRQEPVQFGFAQVFSETLRRPFHFNLDAAPAGGVKIAETFPDFRPGMLRPTDNPLNVALLGPGFFVVETARGERYTRNGDFTIDAEGRLTTQNGEIVQSAGGAPLDVRGGTVVIDREGTIRVNGVPAGKLRMVEFDAPERLEREGDTLYRAPEALLAGRREAAATAAEQSQLEMSNVTVPEEMIKMMMGLRAYEANQRVIASIDSTLGRMIDQVAMPS